MFRFSWLTILVLISSTVAVAEGPTVDLAKIDRTIAKEPVYNSQPRYVLLVVGPRAEHRAWLVIDGEDAYVDRNGNGDLTEPNERIELDREATDKISVRGSAAYTGMSVFPLGEVAGSKLNFHLWVPNPNYDLDQDEIARKRPEIRAYRQDMHDRNWRNGSLMRTAPDGMQCQIPLALTTKPEDAQVCHLLGPLTFTLKRGERQRLEPWPKQTNFDVNLGSRNLPPRGWTRAGFDFSPLTTSEVPATLHPVATFEFPATSADGNPLRQELILDQRCCGDTLFAMLTLPKGVSSGVAKVTVKFPLWIEQVVELASFEVPINQERSQFAEASYVMFHDPDLELKHAVNALRKRGIAVTIRNDVLLIMGETRPSLIVRLNRDPESHEIALGLSPGTLFAADLSRCDARFEIRLIEPDKVLAESKTLQTIEHALQELTHGFVYQTWDQQLSAPK